MTRMTRRLPDDRHHHPRAAAPAVPGPGAPGPAAAPPAPRPWRVHAWVSLGLLAGMVLFGAAAVIAPEGLPDDLLKMAAGLLGLFLCGFAFLALATALSPAQENAAEPAGFASRPAAARRDPPRRAA